MAKGSGSTRATNSRTAHGSGLSAGVKDAVSKFNEIKTNSSQAFDLKRAAMDKALDAMPAGTQVDFTATDSISSNHAGSYVKSNKGYFVQKHVADTYGIDGGETSDHWTSYNFKWYHLDHTMSVKKYNGK